MNQQAAIEALTNALGPTWTEPVPKLVEDLCRAGLTYEDIRTDADLLADALKRVQEYDTPDVTAEDVRQAVNIIMRALTQITRKRT